MTLIIWAVIVIAVLGSLYLRKWGLALVFAALAVAYHWRDNLNLAEWAIFAVIFLIGSVWTAIPAKTTEEVDTVGRIHYRSSGARTGVGVAVLIVTALLASNLNMGSMTAGLFGGQSFEQQVAAMQQGLKGQLDETNARVAALEKRMDSAEANITDLQARVDKLEASDKAQNQRLDAFDKKVSGTASTATPIDLTSEQIAQSLAADLVAQGWSPDDIAIGTVDWDQNRYEVGAPFSPKRTDSTDKLVAMLNGGASPQSKAIVNHMMSVPMSDAEHVRMLSGRGFVPIQFKKDMCLQNNTYYDGNAKVAKVVEKSCHEAGDIVWVYVGSDSKVYWDASVRADCANPGMSTPPAPKDTPAPRSTPSGSTPPPPTPTPSGTPSTTPSSTPTPSTTPSSTPTPSGTPTPSVTPSPKKTEEHPCSKGNCPTDPAGPAPAPTASPDAKPTQSPASTYTPPAQPAPATSTTTPAPVPTQPNEGQPSSSPVPSGSCDPRICG